MYNYGIYGNASITKRFIQGIELSSFGRFKAICSSQTDLPYEDVIVYPDYDQLLKDPSIDIIYLPTPNYLHYDHAYRALAARKHVILEKPFTLSHQSGQALFDYALEHELFLMEAQKIVFLPSTVWLKQALKNELIGPLKSISLKQSFLPGPDKTHWMYSDEKGGGVVYGSGNYPLEFMLHLFDTTELTDFTSKRWVGETGVDEIVEMNFEINEIPIEAKISRVEVFPSQAIFKGSQGEIIINDFWRAKSAQINYYQARAETILFEFESEFVYEVNHIHECLDQERLTSPIMKPELTLACLAYIDKVKAQPGCPLTQLDK